MAALSRIVLTRADNNREWTGQLTLSEGSWQIGKLIGRIGLGDVPEQLPECKISLARLQRAIALGRMGTCGLQRAQLLIVYAG